MLEKEFSSIPIRFSKLEVDENDSRFTRVKIVVAHAGENAHCYFSKEVLESFIEQLAHIPILAIVKENSDDELDFDNHGNKLVKDGNTFKMTYKGHAYGFIPKDNNAKIEEMFGTDGVKRDYLTCEGIMWNKFTEVIELLNSSNYKGQSMELQPSESHGYRDENGMFIYEKAKIDGVCILGDHVTPAMNNSKIYTFSMNDLSSQIEDMINEYHQFSASTDGKGDNILEEELKEPVEPQTFAKDDEKDKEKEDAKKDKDVDVEETDEKSDEKPKEDEKDEKPASDKKEKEDDEDEKKKKPISFSVEISHEDKRHAIYKALQKSDNYGYIADMFDDYAIVSESNYDEDDIWVTATYKQPYTIDEKGEAQLGEKIKVVSKYLTVEESEKIDNDRNQLAELEAQIKGLTEFKAKTEFAERESYLTQFSDKLNSESYSLVKEQLTQFSTVEEVKREVAFQLFNQEENKDNPVTFSQEEPKAEVRTAPQPNKVDNPFGEASRFFHK